MEKTFIPHQNSKLKKLLKNSKNKPSKEEDFGVGFITINSKQTQKLGELLAQELKGGEIVCLDGELGAGKTTFTQGLLKGLKVEGPYTSPTFLVMKQYDFEKVKSKKSKVKTASQNLKIGKVCHIDAYRINQNDLINLGWEEIIANSQNIVIIEWASRIEKILPKNSLRINFEWLDENKRKIKVSSKLESQIAKPKLKCQN